MAILEEFLILEEANVYKSRGFFDISVTPVPSVLFRGISNIGPYGEQLSSYFKP